MSYDKAVGVTPSKCQVDRSTVLGVGLCTGQVRIMGVAAVVTVSFSSIGMDKVEQPGP